MTVDEIFARFDGAYAESTIRSYQGNFAQFSRWCEKAGADPLNVSPEELARFIDHMGGRCAAATVLHHITCIGTIYRLSERPAVDKSPPVTLAMKRIFRAKGRWQKQAIPLTREVLQALYDLNSIVLVVPQSDIVRPKPAPTGFQHGSPIDARCRHSLAR